MVVKTLGLLAGLFLLLVSTAWAEPCKGDFDCNGNVDSDDNIMFNTDYGRNLYNNPCTDTNPCNGDFNCDGNVDSNDNIMFNADFGRNQYFNPCPPCVVGDWCCGVVLGVLDTNAHLGDEWGQVTVSMSDSNHNVKGIQLDLVDGGNDLTCTRCAPDPDRALQFSCSAQEQADGTCKVVLNTTNPFVLISEGEGPIFTIDYTIYEYVPADGCVDLTIENSSVSDEFINPLCVYTDGGEICFIACGDVYPREFLPENPICGDGVVNIFDEMEVIDIVSGTIDPSDCQRMRADVPTGTPPYCTAPDGVINELDVQVIIDKASSRMNCCDYYYFGKIY